MFNETKMLECCEKQLYKRTKYKDNNDTQN